VRGVPLFEGIAEWGPTDRLPRLSCNSLSKNGPADRDSENNPKIQAGEDGFCFQVVGVLSPIESLAVIVSFSSNFFGI
jgi:hypothetical protein